MRTYVSLCRTYLRIGILNELEYRANFFVQLFQALVNLAVSLAGLAVIFANTDTLGGWTQDELLALLGIFFLMGGLFNLILQPSMQRLMEGIRLGTLDFTLMKPADSQFIVSIQQIFIWRLIDIAMGVGVLLYALARMHDSFGWLEAAGFGVALLAGCAIVYSFALILGTSAFWFVRADNILVIFQSMYEAGRWPIGLYPPWLKMTLTFLVPIAFATTVPAEALTARLTWPTLLGAVALAAALLAISRWFWRVGIRHYSGASA